MTLRCYTEVAMLPTFIERYRYLKLEGVVGQSSFGFDRHINQMLYTSQAWRRVRDEVIIRDNGCDLGVPGYGINSKIIVHHMNPITVDDILNNKTHVLDTEFLICVTMATHNAIHYGDDNQLPKEYVARAPGDTTPWS